MPRRKSKKSQSKKFLTFLSLLFLLLVLCSALGLDYIRWKNGDKSYLFEQFGAAPQQQTSVKTETFSDPPATFVPSDPAEENQASSDELSPLSSKNRVALIVDDMGYDLSILKDLSDLGISLTIAVLPHSPWARETAEMAREKGFEVILHLPLESLNDLDSNARTEGLIHSRMDEEKALAVLEEDLAQIPFVQGVNNHMGSKMTALRDQMSPLLSTLKEHHLYFIDSLTSGSSVAYELAREMGIPSASRDVFLDAETDEEFIGNQLVQLLKLAQRRGTAVGICHPHKSTLKVLADQVGLFEQYGCETVFASQIVR